MKLVFDYGKHGIRSFKKKDEHDEIAPPIAVTSDHAIDDDYFILGEKDEFSPDDEFRDDEE